MAKLRLFAGLRDAAGVGSADVEGRTVAEVLEAASARYGTTFARGLSNARVWVNGEEADPGQEVDDGDEVALIPPVSGGAGVLEKPATAPVDLAAPFLVLAALIVANVAESPVWWVTATVALAGLWVADIVDTVASRGNDLPVMPPMLSVLAAVASVWMLGAPGLALAAAAAVALPLIWAVASDSSRILMIISPVILVSLIAGLAVGALTLARLTFVQPARVVGVFLVVALASSAVSIALERFTHLPFGDPFSATALTAVLASVIAAAIWGLDLIAFLIAGLVTAAALVGGRGFGSILRTRRVILIERPPGLLSVLDGAMVAAPLFVLTLRLVA